jgi:hypothetical protein
MPFRLLYPAGLALAGFLAGLAYFALLRRTAELFLAGGGWVRPAALTAVRLSGLVVLLVIAARAGAAALLAFFLGFLIARGLALRVSGKVG